jgi:hypothetical protein
MAGVIEVATRITARADPIAVLETDMIALLTKPERRRLNRLIKA